MKKQRKLITVYGEGPSPHNLLVEARLARLRGLRAQASEQVQTLEQVLAHKMRVARQRQRLGRYLRVAGLVVAVLAAGLKVGHDLLVGPAALPAAVEALVVPGGVGLVLLGFGAWAGGFLLAALYE